MSAKHSQHLRSPITCRLRIFVKRNPSRLVNLLKDQATKLTNIGIPAVTLSDISEENMVVERGAFSVVYGSPEAWLKIDLWRKC